MSESSVEGLVLRRWDSGESDRRISLLTSERGKIYATARGARKAKARLAAVSEPTMYARYSLASGKRNNYVTQAQPLASFPHLRSDYMKLMCAFAFLESVDSVAPLEEPLQEVLELTLYVLKKLEIHTDSLAVLAWSDLRLMDISGFAPRFDASVASDKPLHGEVFLSPKSGGALLAHELHTVHDAVKVDPQVVLTLNKLSELPEPPNQMKRSREVAMALVPFWQEFSGRDLPARQVLARSIPI